MRQSLQAGLSFFVAFSLLNILLFITSTQTGSMTQERHANLVPLPPPVSPAEWANHRAGQLSDVHQRSISDPIPQLGDQKLLILLVDFADQPGLFTGQQWQQTFFGSEGFADYFGETSYGQLRYTGDIVGMDGITPVVNSPTVGYIRLPNPLSFYADGRYGFKIGAAQFPRNNAGVVTHALQILDDAGFDFAPYADPASNQVENLLVIFGGAAHVYTDDPINSLEATGYSLSASGASQFAAAGGQFFNNFTFCPDQEGSNPGTIANIGICAHEHGHALGLPDLYDFSYITSGVGRYDLMGYGAYGATSGARPFHFGAFPKEFLGWVQPTLLQTTTTVIALKPAETTSHMVKLVPNGQVESAEYFLLENRQPLGFDRDWTSANYCPGLYIWHVDQTIVAQFRQRNLINSPLLAIGPLHPGVAIVEADGRNDLIRPLFTYGECSDAWTVGQRWNHTSLPSSRLWSGQESGISLTVQSALNHIVTLTIQLDNLATGIVTPTATASLTATLSTPTLSTPALSTPTVATTATIMGTPSPMATAAITSTKTATAVVPMQTLTPPVGPTIIPTETPTVQAWRQRQIYIPIIKK